MTGVPFIAIEGPIGIGKTSLAEKLSAHFQFQLLKEIVEENPFLGKFYENIEEWSFQTEMFFLCNRFKQLEDIDKQYLRNDQPVVADYHISKNMIFAKRTLPKDKFQKYEQIYRILTEDMPVPNMMIYLNASLDTILERIQKRGRQIEQNIQASYLAQLAQDYEDYMNQFEKLHPNIPVIRIDGDKLDFVCYQEHLVQIIELVSMNLKQLTID
ncbi:deoxyguanosine kinase [Virgibacillus pantothenticus]|uniref:Deoxyguanosine kinase n=1 Tax=Virgibacillus pantothenticus TaxID=1473 RepID=A0A0L0QRE1_VIRPA|nr:MULTISPECIES: deoxynucleoside kinase [Virgibacillus]API92245.1 deoxynucleoside kinase [Virgibacillus sp. 6R]KNE21147.1 deoxyguanosine kinase [Virgibacillus pantothenticus]MBS7427157.1 deoxynucleoside kinase [Virgibacillus sp. 19R1-5]MBU8567485.1 deoxynucleoside kinase [Virgibacillus pantothenticus]MBU8601153.1 deoxynucleoside kinase [Virgibacillus pantothenticus]